MKVVLSILLLMLISLPCFALPIKVELPVPFICQAPFGDWKQPYADACEEAAIIMAMGYVKNIKEISPKSARDQILDLVEYEVKNTGEQKDLNAEETAKLIRDYYKYSKIMIKCNPSVSDIKNALISGKVVIAPTAGRLLNNPYFKRPGPVYHMLVIKGFDDNQGVFIVNDNGTKRGQDYKYKYAVLMSALHEWAGNKDNILSGKKVIIIVMRP